MHRRQLVLLMGSAPLALPLSAIAQNARTSRVGALYLGTADAESFRQGIRDGLRELGYVEGSIVAFEFRSSEGHLERLPELAADLVRLKVDVIVALYVPCALAAKNATKEIPIVIIAGDPVETGIVPSLASSGSNITGVSLMAAASNGKSVELFRDMIPSVRRIGVLGHSPNPVFAKAMLEQVERAGHPTGLRIGPVAMVRSPDDFEGAFASMKKEGADAVVVQGSLAIKPIADLALKYRLPSASTARAYAEVGGLMAYGADGPASFRHGTKFVQAILQGKQPRDLPIEQPTKFDLAVNLNTAKTIGLAIPQAFLLARAPTLV
jgi:putative ABC transport system substrate-binding protein